MARGCRQHALHRCMGQASSVPREWEETGNAVTFRGGAPGFVRVKEGLEVPREAPGTKSGE